MARWTGSWRGGRTRLGRNDETVWVIEALRGPRRYSISLEVNSEADALAELALFERNPESYAAAREREPVPATCELTSGLILEFLKSKQLGEDGKPVSQKYLKDLLRYLESWRTVLGGRDLARVTLAEYRGMSRKLKPRRYHIAALRSLTKWLRREGRLSANDPTRELEVPQTNVRRAGRAVGYPLEQFDEFYSCLLDPGNRDFAQTVRDVLVLRALCGMHYTEIRRMAEGAWKVRRLEGYGEIAGTVTFIHKRGEPHPVSLPAKALAAAERLQKVRKLPDEALIHRFLDACAERAGMPRIRPNELRHSFVTWSRTRGRVVYPHGAGVPREVIARIVGHTSVNTTEIYDDTKVPEMIALPLELDNPADPPLPPLPEEPVVVSAL